MQKSRVKMNFLMIHGIYGKPEENWFPWLKKELEMKAHEVIIPRFPTPIGQTLENWLKVMKHHEDKINEDTVLIGHSLGATFILDYLEQADREVRAAILVSGWHENIENPFKKLNNTFVDKKFAWNKIAENCEEFIVIGSDNDEYIPEDVTRRLSFKLDAELHIIHNGGHLNADSGYKKFPLLLDVIEKLHEHLDKDLKNIK